MIELRYYIKRVKQRSQVAAKITKMESNQKDFNGTVVSVREEFNGAIYVGYVKVEGCSYKATYGQRVELHEVLSDFNNPAMLKFFVEI